MYLHCKGLGHHVVQLTFLVALILDQIAFRVFNLAGSLTLFLLLSFCIDRPFRFSIYFFIYFCIILFYFIAFFFFFFFTQECRKKGCTWKLPHAKFCMTASKLLGILKSCHFNQNQGSFGEGLLQHIQAHIGQGKLSSVIRHGLGAFLQDQVAFFKDSGSNFLVECSLDVALVQLSMAHCGHALLVYHVQLFISRTGPLSF